MRKYILCLLAKCCQLSFAAPVDSLVVKTDSSDVRHQVLIKTTMGDITVELYNETPRHRDNFLRLAREVITTATCGTASSPIS